MSPRVRSALKARGAFGGCRRSARPRSEPPADTHLSQFRRPELSRIKGQFVPGLQTAAFSRHPRWAVLGMCSRRPCDPPTRAPVPPRAPRDPSDPGHCHRPLPSLTPPGLGFRTGMWGHTAFSVFTLNPS